MYEEDESGATQVFNPDDPLMGIEWSVNVSDDQTRTMRAAEIAFEFLNGKLDAEDTFVWRDGLDDWLPLGECGELQDVIRQYQAGQNRPGPQPGYDAYGAVPQDDGEEDLGSTVMLDTSNQPTPHYGNPAYQPPSSVGSSSGDEVSRTMASPLEYPTESDPIDPFRDVRPPEADASRRVGERNEASALFSLADLHAAASAPSEPAKERDPFDDIMNFGGGGGGGIASAFAPPPIHAPAPPPPPKPAPPPVVQASAPPPAMSLAPSMQPAMMVTPQQRNKKLGFIIGGVAAAVLLLGMGIGLALSGDDESTAKLDGDGSAKESATDDKPTDDKATDDAAEDDDKDADDEAAKDEETAKNDEDDKDAKDDDNKADDDKTAAVTPTKTTDTKKVDTSDKKADDKKADDKKADTADDKKADKKAKSLGEFNRDAARSALAGAAGAASGCKKKGGPTGRGRVTVTFAPSGRATQANVGPPFGGTSVGSCAAAAFKGASVPPFDGGAVTVSKTFFIK